MTAQRDAACIANRAKAYQITFERNAVLRAFGEVDAGTRAGLVEMARANKMRVNRLLAILLKQGKRYGV